MGVSWKARLVAIGATIMVGVACQESSTGPSASRPNFDFVPPPPGLTHCRMMPTLGTSVEYDAGGVMVGPCSVPAQWSPNYYFTGVNPPTITFTFSRPVLHVWITPYGSTSPTCPSTPIMATAYDAAGAVIASGPIYNCNGGSPGDFHSFGPTAKIVLTPPVPFTVDPTRLTIDYYVPCPPTGDSLMDSRDLRQAFLGELALSRPNPDGTGKKERGFYIFQRDADQTYFLEPFSTNATATDCGVDTPAGPEPTIAGAHFTGRVMHTHPSYHGERLYGCRKAGPNDIVTADRDPKWGGGSIEDWQLTDDTGAKVYIIDLDKKVYRLEPGTPMANWPTHSGRWQFDSRNECLIPLP